MQNVRASGFILPFTLLLASAILVLAVLSTSHGFNHLRAREHALLRSRTDSLLRLNVKPLVDKLASRILEGDSTSALIELDPDVPESLRPILLNPEGSRIPLHSESAPGTMPTVRFASPLSDMDLAAETIPLSPDGHPEQFTIAWAAEDIALAAPQAAPWPAWPLESWFMAPGRTDLTLPGLLGAETLAVLSAGPWVPEGEPLPFTESGTPALAPVVTWLGLRFGIFASGAVGSREKIIRIRYYLEGGVWNPYNRPLRFHDAGAAEPVFRLIFWNLPEVRIQNLTQGVSTAWISLDQAVNPQTGKQGIEAWVSLPAILEPGNEEPFLEPDASSQPEGLARTLHGGFAVGPGDRVKVEFRMPAEGISAACLPMDADDPLEAARAGLGWFRVENFTIELEPLEFYRADAEPAPFYLASGSMGFRQENAQSQILMQRNPACFAGMLDPRRHTFRNGTAQVDAQGVDVPDESLLECTIRDLRIQPTAANAAALHTPLFSWPENQPDSLLAAGDLPQWPEGFRLGSANASRLNALLDRQGSLLPDPAHYIPAVPVNMISAESWKTLLEQSDRNTADPDAFIFAAYPVCREGDTDHFRSWNREALDDAARQIAGTIRKEPSCSIGDFFNRGLLADAMKPVSAGDPVHSLLPLRGWLREAPPLVRHGSAWILHLLVEGTRKGLTVRRSARVWLLERARSDTETGFEIIRFEWTDPAEHCRLLPP